MNGIGLIGAPPTCTSKCKCAPVASPALPTRAMAISPFATLGALRGVVEATVAMAAAVLAVRSALGPSLAVEIAVGVAAYVPAALLRVGELRRPRGVRVALEPGA